MIVISEELLANAANAVAECLASAQTTSGKNISFKLDNGFLRRGVLSLIAMHEPSDYSIGVMVENTQLIHTEDDGMLVSWPPTRARAQKIEDTSCHS